MDMKTRILGSLLGAAVGDALGVPYEFNTREEQKSDPATTMVGYGTYDQPKGTWSDDTSMMLGVAKALSDTAEQTPGDALIHQMVRYFLAWHHDHDFNANGMTFDRGIATSSALEQYPTPYDVTAPLSLHGRTGERDQGNGSLMRILPLALWNALHPMDVHVLNQASAITHAHPHLLGICAHYIAFVGELVQWAQKHPDQTQAPVAELLKAANQSELVKAQDLPYTVDVEALLARDYESLDGSGYVLSSIETSYWCLAHSRSFEEATLKAVNLGQDTDTNACIVGGLMGLIQGLEGIPGEWLESLRNRALLDDIYLPFTDKLLK